MPENNEEQKIQDGLSGIIPDSILEVLGSEGTAVKISGICLENGVSKEKDIEEVGYRIGLVLLGNLPPEDLAQKLGEKLGLSPEAAEKIYSKINELVFLQVKDDLVRLYEEKLKKPPTLPPSPPSEEPQKPRAKDTYREPTE